jgi:hypothetical protein
VPSLGVDSIATPMTILTILTIWEWRCGGNRGARLLGCRYSGDAPAML